MSNIKFNLFSLHRKWVCIIKTNHKNIRLVISITQLLAKYNCTFEETDKILSLIDSEIKMQRRNLEYKSIKNFMENNKVYNADDDYIVPLNFTEEYSQL